MNYADVISSSQTAIAIAARLALGPFAAGYVNFLLGQASFTAQLADLCQKIEDGTATATDYAEVAKAGGDIVLGLGAVTGLASSGLLIGWAAVGIVLFAVKNRDNIGEALEYLKADPYVWKTNLPEDFRGQIDQQVDEFTDPFSLTNGNISEFTNMCYRDARRWQPPRDPLVLDLDGDGIETVGISGNTPILFDHDADGTRTGTGWIKPDDGLLVLDRNGNGTIDSGRELFGDETLLPNGDKAANGYAALAQYDANGDGKISSADAVYAELRVWQDANQDGISQANELRTLADLGIASLGVQGTAANVNLGNGNTMPLSGSFTRTDGSAGTSGVAELSGSLLLANNGFYREFTDDPLPTEAAKALPQMRGSGWVRDLREAMSDPGGAGAALQSQVQAFAAAKTRDAQLALLDGLLAEWAKSSGKKLDAIWTYELVQDAAGHYTTGLQRPALGALPVFLKLNPDGMVRTLGGTGTGTGGGGRPSLATGAARRRRCGHRSPTSRAIVPDSAQVCAEGTLENRTSAS